MESNYRDAGLVKPHEPLDGYKPGGYHPVALGDTFNFRYTVRHKLGHGASSTVWLAWDRGERSWTALKILKAQLSYDELETHQEINVFNILEKNHAELQPSKPRPFVQILDCFHHTGPNGRHTCIVMELLGPTLAKVWDIPNRACPKERLLPDSVLRTSKQLLEGIAFAHEAGICHSGPDISPHNVAFTCFQIQGSDEVPLLQVMERPITAGYQGKQRRSPNVPQHLDETRKSLPQPNNLRSPETFFVGRFDFRHDLWRAGAVVYSLMFKQPLFTHALHAYQLVQSQARLLGSFPDEWASVVEWVTVNKLKRSTQVMTGQHISNQGGPSRSPAQDQRGTNITAVRDSKDPGALGRLFSDRQAIFTRNIKISCGSPEAFQLLSYDCDNLGDLLPVIEGLMQHDPASRMLPLEAALRIRWKDKWKLQM